MNFNLSKSLVQIIGPEHEKLNANFNPVEEIALLRSTAPESSIGINLSKPVLQMCGTPTPIDLENFTNAYSAVNQNGDLRSLYAISSLANNIPNFSNMYFPSGNRLDVVYDNILNGYSISGVSTMTSNSMATAKRIFLTSGMPSLTNSPVPWYAVNATPYNWVDMLKAKSNLISATMDLTKPEGAFNNQFNVINEEESDTLQWNQLSENGTSTQTPLDSGTALKTIKFKFMIVYLDRQWFTPSIFNLDGWNIMGEQAGFISSGLLNPNSGILPLFTTAFIVATDLEIVGDLTQNDKARLTGILLGNSSVGVGPFKINQLSQEVGSNAATMVNNNYFILGWISELVCKSPKN